MSGQEYTNGYEDGREAMRKEMEAQLAAKQAQVDELMMQYCLDEMTKEQLDNWGKHQVRASPEQEAAADAAMKDAK